MFKQNTVKRICAPHYNASDYGGKTNIIIIPTTMVPLLLCISGCHCPKPLLEIHT